MSISGAHDATGQLLDNFDIALTSFEKDVRAGKANVRVINRNAGKGGAGAFGALDAADSAGCRIIAYVHEAGLRP